MNWYQKLSRSLLAALESKVTETNLSIYNAGSQITDNVVNSKYL